MTLDKLLIVGCSLSNGSGLPGEHDNPHIWPNHLARQLGINTIRNVAQTGANNHWIFLETVSELAKSRYDLVLVEWSAIPRYKINVGLELYTTDSMLDQSVNLVGRETISAAWLCDLKNRLLKLHNDHWDILNLVKYVNTLIELQTKLYRGKIFFINGLAPWSNQYFVRKPFILPSKLDKYTYDILQSDQRDDSEVFQLYNMIHDQYQEYGGIQDYHWLNLYDSLMKTKIDTVSSTDLHPGYASQGLYSNNFYKILKEKLNT
jgi:hypothetical protein